MPESFVFGYKDINHPYVDATWLDQYPRYKYWVNEPLSQDSIIHPRRAGFQPYKQNYVQSTREPFVYSDCPFYQYGCDLIVPVNQCYIKEPQEWVGNILFNR